MKTLKIYGSPGTGKTHAMLEYFEEELKTVKPNRIAFLTFTRAARLEALARASLDEKQLPYVKTIHAICYRLMSISQDQMIKPKDLRAFGKKLGVEITGIVSDPTSLDLALPGASQPTKADILLQLNHLGRHRKIHLKEAMKDAPLDIDWAFAKWFTESYRRWKQATGLVDYTDLLTLYLSEGGPLAIDTMFVDEAQDLSVLQWEVVHKLGLNAQRRYLAGDDDQAIFTWAGASPEIFNNEPADENRVLPVSYRLPRSVLDLSQRIISRVKRRFPKRFNPRDADGLVRAVGNLSYDLLTDRHSFILFRNHHRGVYLGGLLEELNWPYTGSLSPLGNPQVQACLEGWRLVHEKQDTLPATYARAMIDFGHVDLIKPNAKLAASNARHQVPWHQILRFLPDPKLWPLEKAMPRLPKVQYIANVIRTAGIEAALNPPVTLMSIHQSKGRQANTVILDLEMAWKTYDGYMKEPDSEHRVFYVGVTRTFDRLFTLMPSDASAYNL